MRKAFEVIAGAGILASARHNHTIFTGEHADKRHIDHGNGRHSLKMKSIKSNMNKYESVIYRGSDLFPERKPLAQ